MTGPTCWMQPGGCSTCKYCGMDMDLDPYCAHPDVVKKYKWGLNINSAIQDFCGEDLALRVPDLDRERAAGHIKAA